MAKVELISDKDFQLSNWSGGQTKQLFIYPKDQVHTNQTFAYRLSTATIEANSSKFTPFPTYHRILMTLDQTINLRNMDTHEDFFLAPLIPYSFSGKDRVYSEGNCTDFNLIYSDDYQGHIQLLSISEVFHSQDEIQFIYPLTDTLVHIEQEELPLKAGQLLHIQTQEKVCIQCHCLQETPHIASGAIWVGLTKRKSH